MNNKVYSQNEDSGIEVRVLDKKIVYYNNIPLLSCLKEKSFIGIKYEGGVVGVYLYNNSVQVLYFTSKLDDGDGYIEMPDKKKVLRQIKFYGRMALFSNLSLKNRKTL